MSTPDPIDALAAAVTAALGPPDPIEALATAVADAFALADSVEQARRLRAQAEAKYGPTRELLSWAAHGPSARI